MSATEISLGRQLLERKTQGKKFPNALQRTLLSWRWWLGRKEDLGPPPQLTVAVLIPAYNEEKSIAATITAVLNQDHPLITQIIVIDDCSTDRTNEIAQGFVRSHGITLMRPEKNLGTKARAQNFAIPHVKAQILATIDGDTILEPDAISKALPYFNDPRTGATCGFVVPQFSKSMWERGRVLEYLYAFTIIKSAQEHLFSILVASGCFTLFDFDIIKAYGGFDERTWGEDMDMTWRMMEDGYLIRFASAAVCRVVDPPDYRTFKSQVTRWSHSFLQNIKVRHYNLFRLSFRLGLVAYFYLIWQFVGPVWVPITVWYLSTDTWRAAAWLAGFYGIMVVLPGMYKGHQLGFPPRLILRSIGPFFLIQFVNIYFFGKAVTNEWIRGVSITQWEKGH